MKGTTMNGRASSMLKALGIAAAKLALSYIETKSNEDTAAAIESDEPAKRARTASTPQPSAVSAPDPATHAAMLHSQAAEMYARNSRIYQPW